MTYDYPNGHEKLKNRKVDYCGATEEIIGMKNLVQGKVSKFTKNYGINLKEIVVKCKEK
jgi:hypothetical protein